MSAAGCEWKLLMHGDTFSGELGLINSYYVLHSAKIKTFVSTRGQMVTSLLPGMINSACRGTETEIAFALLSRWEQNSVYEIHTPRG